MVDRPTSTQHTHGNVQPCWGEPGKNRALVGAINDDTYYAPTAEVIIHSDQFHVDSRLVLLLVSKRLHTGSDL